MIVYGKCECFVMLMLYACVLCASWGSSQSCLLHDMQLLMLVEDERDGHMEEAPNNTVSKRWSCHSITDC